MKKIYSSVLCYMLCVTCFVFPACVSHELEMPPASPDGNVGKADDPNPDFKKEVADALAASPPYAFSYGNIPLEWIWANINYNRFDYKKFFSTNCPNARQNSETQMICRYEDQNSKRFFSVNVYQNLVIVNIEEMSLTNYILSRQLKAIWEITGTEEDFTVVKYEKITSDGHQADYSMITTRHINRDNRLIASGISSSCLSGSFTFETDGLRYASCPEKPEGYIFIRGLNLVGVDFYQTKNCDSCAPTIFDGEYGKYSYCGPWPLRDLFEYLTPFIQ